MIGIVYHEDYNKYDLGLDHPLVRNKPKKTIEFFKKKGLLEELHEFKAKKATEKDLLRIHSPYYVERIKSLSKSGGVLSFDTPAPKGIYEIARLVTGGTILAGEKLLKGFDIMANPLAGFHHAGRDNSSGFCFFNDIGIVIEYIRTIYDLKRFQIIDLDVHHSNGTQDIYYDDSSVLKISFHQDGKTLYPGTGSIEKIGKEKGKGFNINFPFLPGSGGKGYLYAFKEIIPPITKQFNPEMIIYQSGVDTHHSDPLANLKLTYQTYYELAKYIRMLSTETCQKLLVLFGGGYNCDSSIISYYNIMCGLIDNKNIINEIEIQDDKYDHIVNQVEELKKILSNYWEI